MMTPENKTVEIEVKNPRGGGKTVVLVEGVNKDLRESLQKEGFVIREAAPELRGFSVEGKELEERFQAEAEKKAGKETYLDIPESELPVPEFLPFSVDNRTRAEKIVKMLYGPQARIRSYPNQEPPETRVQIVRQEGNRAIILRQGKDFSSALSEPLESFVKGGKDLQDVERRIRDTAPLAELGIMAYRALMQFPQYVDGRRKALFKQREALKKANEKVSFSEIVGQAKKSLGHSDVLIKKPSPFSR